MKNENEIRAMVESSVMNTLTSIAENDLDPEFIADGMCVIFYMTSFAEDIGVKLPYRFSHKMIDKLFDCCLAVWPDMKNYVPVGLVPERIMEDQNKAGSMLRMALTSVYNLELDEDCPIPNSGIFDHEFSDATTDEELDDAIDFLRLFGDE